LTISCHNRVDKVLLSAAWKDEDLPALSGTLDDLKQRGFDVTVFGPIVEYDAALPRLLAEGIMRGDPAIASTRRTAGIRERDQATAKLVAAHGATYVSVYDAACRGGRCVEFAEGDVPMQFDAGHLTAQGSIEVARRLNPSFVKMLARADHAPD
jgi:SGNH domain (fused to AT3 domains)